MRAQKIPQAEPYIVRNRLQRFWGKVVPVIACIVVLCTIYILILPAIT